MLDNTEAIYIDKVESLSTSIRLVSKVGKEISLYCSGVGKALLSHMSDEEISKIFENSDIRKHTDNTCTTLEQLMEKIQYTRKSGFALDEEENEVGVVCVAVAIKDFENKYNYAISISTSKQRITNQKINLFASYLLDAKKEIEKQIFNDGFKTGK